MVLKIHCSFCGTHHNDRKLIVVKDNDTICNECVAACEEVINEGKEKLPLPRLTPARVPIYEKLKEFNNVYKLTGSILKSK